MGKFWPLLAVLFDIWEYLKYLKADWQSETNIGNILLIHFLNIHHLGFCMIKNFCWLKLHIMKWLYYVIPRLLFPCGEWIWGWVWFPLQFLIVRPMGLWEKCKSASSIWFFESATASDRTGCFITWARSMRQAEP